MAAESDRLRSYSRNTREDGRVGCWLQIRGFVRAVNVSAFSPDSVRLWTAQQARGRSSLYVHK